VSALQEGRNFIGIEKNEDVALFKNKPIDYIEVCQKRLIDAWANLPEEPKRHIARFNLFSDKDELSNKIIMPEIANQENEQLSLGVIRELAI
jgi:DNA (cytosine-5-)-methyltransferase